MVTKSGLHTNAGIISDTPAPAPAGASTEIARLLELMPAAVYTCDAEGRITYFNRRAAELWGREPAIDDDDEKFCGSFRLKLPDGSELPHACTPMAKAIETGEPARNREVAIVRPDGAEVEVLVNIDPLFDEAGKLSGAINVFQDVSDRRRYERALEESEGRYHDLIQALGVAVYTTDADGRITMYNEAAAELWGRRPAVGQDEWCGSWKLYYTDGRPMRHEECPMAVTLKENRSVLGEMAVAEKPDGTRVAFMPFPTPIRDHTGRLVGAVNVLVDITDRQTAEVEAERQRDLVGAIAANMSVGLIMIDREGRIEYMNPAAELITGYRFEEVRGRPKHEVMHHQHPNGHPFLPEECPITEATREGRSISGREDVFVRPDGTFYSVRCNVAPIISHGVNLGAVIDLRDATEEKRAEEAIRESLALKDQFLGLISHELRTPIATILGNAVLLQRRGHLLGDAQKMRALRDVADEAGKLQRIIENLLLLTRLDAGQQPFEPEPLRLPPLVKHVVEDFWKRRPERTVKVSFGDEVPIVRGQSTGLSLVLENLIGNADKYSPLGAPIEVIVSTREDGKAEVRVRDHGIGLTDTEANEVFTAFFRGERARNQAKGIGLGLAVCKRVVEELGGTIWAEARSEGGCDFVFTLQAERTP